jgi:hypothetical protein
MQELKREAKIELRMGFGTSGALPARVPNTIPSHSATSLT